MTRFGGVMRQPGHKPRAEHERFKEALVMKIERRLQYFSKDGLLASHVDTNAFEIDLTKAVAGVNAANPDSPVSFLVISVFHFGMPVADPQWHEVATVYVGDADPDDDSRCQACGSEECDNPNCGICERCSRSLQPGEEEMCSACEDLVTEDSPFTDDEDDEEVEDERPKTMMDQHWHAKDSDCTVAADGLCTGCGVDHSETCAECGGRGFHCANCGMTRGAVMFRDYEAGAEWLDRTCCA